MTGLHRGTPPALLLLLAVAASPAMAQQTSRAALRCESDGGYVRCPAAGTWRGARLVQQISTTACLQGRNWGFDRSAVWVNDGCRGLFDAGDPFANVGERVTCASPSGRRAECAADTRYGVKLLRQLSTVGCIEGRTWGTADGILWVDRGCRGEFEIGGDAVGGPPATQRMTCGSHTGLQTTCRLTGYATGVRLARELNSGRCREGETWGYTDAFIWTRRGCRAEFVVSYRGAPAGAPEAGATLRQRVTCGGSTGQRVTCAVDGRVLTARLVREHSAGRCRPQVTWGHDARALWIDDGCIADFELTVRVKD